MGRRSSDPQMLSFRGPQSDDRRARRRAEGRCPDDRSSTHPANAHSDGVLVELERKGAERTGFDRDGLAGQIEGDLLHSLPDLTVVEYEAVGPAPGGDLGSHG